VRRDLERRPQAVEPGRAGAKACEVWIEQNDNMLRGPWGETITHEVVRSAIATIVVLPENRRDARRDAGRGVIEFWIDEGDEMVRGPRGERITRDAFNHLQSRGRPPTGAVMILSYPEDELL
jgi:hypothetical protein